MWLAFNHKGFSAVTVAMYTHPCMLVGLQARPELNGAVGVCERFDGTLGRYGVRLPGREQPLAVQAANLQLLEGESKDEL